MNRLSLGFPGGGENRCSRGRSATGLSASGQQPVKRGLLPEHVKAATEGSLEKAFYAPKGAWERLGKLPERESETGVRRETMSRYDKLRVSNPAKVTPGSKPRQRSSAATFHDERSSRSSRGSECEASLAGPGRGVRLRLRIRVGQTLRAQAEDSMAPGWISSSARCGLDVWTSTLLERSTRVRCNRYRHTRDTATRVLGC